MTNEYKPYNLTKEKSKNDINNNNEFKLDINYKNTNNINIKNTHKYLDAGKIKTLNKMDINGNYKDENCLQNGSNICKTNNCNEDKTKYKCQIYQKNKAIIKNNVFKINGNEKNLNLNNGSVKNTENGSPKIINNKEINNNSKKYQPSQSPSSINLGEKFNKIKIRKKMDNKFKIKNIYKITNKENDPKREVKKKEKEDLSVKEDEEEEEDEEEKVEDDIEDEKEENDDDISETEEDEETEETVSDDDNNNKNKKYINNKYNIEKTRNENHKFKYINNSNSEINKDSMLKNAYLNKNNTIKNNQISDNINNIKKRNKIQKPNNIEVYTYENEKKIDDNKNKILNNIEIQKSLIYNNKTSKYKYNYFSYITNNDKNNNKKEKQFKNKNLTPIIEHNKKEKEKQNIFEKGPPSKDKLIKKENKKEIKDIGKETILSSKKN